MRMGTSLSFLAGSAPAWSRSRFAIPTEGLEIAWWSTELDSGLASGNAALALFFNLPEGMTEAIPVPRLLAAIHPQDIMRVIAARQATLAHGDRFEIVYRVQGRDRQRTLLAHSHVERDDAGRPVRHMGEARELRI